MREVERTCSVQRVQGASEMIAWKGDGPGIERATGEHHTHA